MLVFDYVYLVKVSYLDRIDLRNEEIVEIMAGFYFGRIYRVKL